MSLILASASPRRKELLKMFTTDFTVVVSEVEEVLDETMTPQEYVADLAKQKAQAVAKLHPAETVIGCDTIVVFQNQVLEKPKNRVEAKQMLQAMSDDVHEVLTAVTIIKNGAISSTLETAKVYFYPLTDSLIESYLDQEDYQDKAGAYGIQSYAALFVEKIEGDYYTIMGFPLAKVYRMLHALEEAV
ncbi:Maf family protein [Isobaculum melis]|uniref:dTTP/UTP pyrophosphatase n=1 Tax=Isobaculum melis TaxID=142588 RepID=A0A1H9RGE2_9LACT|nr:Maf family protein [Isobaculum melis]SER71762.1 septum formation protein [Isobaculum melis]